MKNPPAKKQNSFNVYDKNREFFLQYLFSIGWIREIELIYFLEKTYSIDIIRRTLVRLRNEGLIKRSKLKYFKPANKIENEFEEDTKFYYGIYLSLTEKGAWSIGKEESFKKVFVSIDKWKHDVTAARSLYFLKGYLNQNDFLTERQMRSNLKLKTTAKCTDGTVMPANIYFEQERSKKTGKELLKQVRDICEQARLGRDCYISYPYHMEQQPRFERLNYDHEKALLNAIYKEQPDAELYRIFFLRNYYNNSLEYERALPNFYQVLQLQPERKLKLLYSSPLTGIHPVFSIPQELD